LGIFTGLTSNDQRRIKMATQQLPLPGEIVKKSNALARARWSAASVWEPRLVALLASKVRTNDTDFHVYEIPVSEILRGSSGRDYQEIAAVVDKVMSRVLTIYDDEGWTKYNVFSRCRYKKKTGILELGFHPDLRPHYLNLQKKFVEMNLMEYLTLPSIYSQRIYEILKSWDDQPETVIPLAELHEMLNTPNSYRKNFTELRRFVLEKAHKDILAHTSLRYEWERVKWQGQAAIRFTFGPGRRAIAEAETKTVQEDKRRRAMLKAVSAARHCAETKAGVCAQDNKPRTCKACADMGLCAAVRKKAGS
jgi:plasmid replication initiation protein